MAEHINWYPGHMKKTKEIIQSHLKLVDVVVEVLDARIPISSRNPQIDQIVGDKPRIVALNKYDLADPQVLRQWIEYYKEKGVLALPINAITGEGLPKLLEEVMVQNEAKIEKYKRQGRNMITSRVMIVGIPNVGKSSLINKLVGKNIAMVGNKPGVTRGKQWIKIRKDLELFDTPGILWPKIDDQRVGLNLAFTGAIKDQILPIDEIAFTLLGKLKDSHPKLLVERYKLETIEGLETIEIMEAIGTKRGCLKKRGEIDYDKVGIIVMDEFRKGVIGKISLETPKEIEEVEAQAKLDQAKKAEKEAELAKVKKAEKAERAERTARAQRSKQAEREAKYKK
jgi:ribosome biogenesis GTPase A